MRIVCPNCSAHYDVAENAIPATGREVQCTNCEHVWLQEPALKLEEPAPAPVEEPAYFRSMRTEQTPAEPVEPALSAPPIPKTPAAPSGKDDILGILRSEAEFANNADKSETPAQTNDTTDAPRTDSGLTMAELSASVAAQLNSGDTETTTDAPAAPAIAEPSDGDTIAPETPSDIVEETATVDQAIHLGDETPTSTDMTEDVIQDAPMAGDIYDPASVVVEPAQDAETDVAQDDIDSVPEQTDTTDAGDDLAATVAAAATATAAGAGAVAANPFKKFKPKSGATKTEPEPDTPKTSAQETFEAAAAKSASPKDLSLDQMGLKRRTAKPKPETTDAPAPDETAEVPKETEEAPKKRYKFGKDVFADVDMLGSALDEEAEKESERAAAERAAAKAEEDDDEDDLIIKGSGGGSDGRLFWTGFWAASIAVVAGTAIYYFAPQVSTAAPFAADAIDSFVSSVDQGRRGLQDLYVEGGEPSLSNFGKNAMSAILGG